MVILSVSCNCYNFTLLVQDDSLSLLIAIKAYCIMNVKDKMAKKTVN